MNELEVIEGEIYEIIYSNEENGYTVCEVKLNNSLFTACGHMPYIAPGEGVRLSGKWVTHPDYGEQFSVEFIERILPRQAASIFMYLASGIISGVRESTAKKLVDKFGEDTLKIIASEPERLAEIKGISLAKAMRISDSFLVRQEAAETVIFLQGYGITAKTALRIHKKFGSTAVEMIKNDPYVLCESVERIGFKTADRIAKEMGIPKNNRSRIASGIKFALLEASLSGHTCYEKNSLLESCTRFLLCEYDEIYSVYIEMKNNMRLIEEDEFVYLPIFYNTEMTVAARLCEMNEFAKKNKAGIIKVDIEEYSAKNGIKLSKMQTSAVEMACTSGVLVITGGPGTGKTTIMKTIVDIYRDKKLSVALCAPTGKAAKRLSEACGAQARTLHRLLGVEIKDRDDQKFSKNEQNPLDYDAIVVDEMSMVDIVLFAALLKAMKKGTRLIMAGDADQLPSVGAGNVLCDILESNVINAVRLNEVFRQAGESHIVVNAHRINNGEMPLANEKDKDFFFMSAQPDKALETICALASERLPKAYGFNPMNNIQILSPSRKGIVGTINLNKVLQERLNPPEKSKKEKKFGERIFRVGDKVIQTKNNYDIIWSTKNGKEEGIGIYNGDIGTVIDIIPRDNMMLINFDEDRLVEYEFASVEDLEIAYALTVHKSQGCEFDAVIIPVCPVPPMLMTRNLLYTAVTRAKKLVILIGSDKCVMTMVNNNRVQVRYSGLRKRLGEAMK